MAFHLNKCLAQFRLNALRQHLVKRHPDLERTIAWGKDEKQLRPLLAKTINDLPKGHEALIADLERVDLLADGAGDRAMTAVCAGAQTLVDHLHDLPCVHERALWLYDENSALFERAEEVRYADYYAQGRQWSGFVGPHDRWPDLAPERVEQLKSRIGSVFRGFDGSGRTIDISPFEQGHQPAATRRRAGVPDRGLSRRASGNLDRIRSGSVVAPRHAARPGTGAHLCPEHGGY